MTEISRNFCTPKFSRKFWLAVVIAIPACVPVVNPSAAEVAAQVEALENNAGPVLEALADHGFLPLTAGRYGGPQPQSASGACVEKARGNALYGVDVVRLCHDGAGRVEGVYAMQTHNPVDWIEVRSGP